ncbi:ArdC family protein [Allosphingosinicella deserti]|uniref:Antirestriction protein ArdC n=1 Tax=Allosphingosinicella deserti TaxID=2116704 RepID=A0A2P7QWI2_9SPHN|nr:zincin-like metallopeptidase domain-containing protein [Sphingomonas deserti]PSJ42338.1 antirestriction protein ArdC [Sphingomonas deserti]
MRKTQAATRASSLYAEVTDRIIAELEAGRLPWVQPWDSASCGPAMPHNGGTGRHYSGINVLILWSAVVEGGYSSHRWLTFRQALALGGHVRKGEKGTIVCYADRFTPRDEAEKARDEDGQAKAVAFLKRFVVFNVDQCDGLPSELIGAQEALGEREAIPHAEALIAATGAEIRIGGGLAFYAPDPDFVQVPPQQYYPHQINWYRTLLHELGHWTGHSSRLGRVQSGFLGGAAYAREELVAELTSAFTCASLAIQPTVRHSDYIGAWLDVLRGDDKAIFRAASAASKAADYLLAFAPDRENGHG